MVTIDNVCDLLYSEFFPFIEACKYYQDNEKDSIPSCQTIHTYAKGCYNLRKEIIRHYPGLHTMSYELLVDYYFDHVEHYGEIDDPLHLANLIALENNAHYVDSDVDFDSVESDDDSMAQHSDATMSVDTEIDNRKDGCNITLPKTGKQLLIDDFLEYSPVQRKSFQCVCGVCKELAGVDQLALLNCCSHKFCYDCIFNWCTIKPECPVCRRNVTRLDRYVKSGR